MSGSTEPTRASQVVVEALVVPTDTIRVSQVVIEAIIGTLGYVRTSQVVGEVLFSSLGFVRISQVTKEVLIGNSYEVPMPTTYPTLLGLTFPVVKTPIFSTQTGAAASGREVRIGMYTNPIWEFTLTYDYLPDKWITNPNSSDLKTLMGFYISQAGSLLPFQFKDPDDNTVQGQLIGTTDGVTANYYLSRTFGGTDGTLTEPIGMVDESQAFEVYLNGDLKVAGTDYNLITTTPLANFIQFLTTPAADEVITVNMSYFYWVRFKDDQYDFNKFMSNLWEAKKIVLHSLRG